MVTTRGGRAVTAGGENTAGRRQSALRAFSESESGSSASRTSSSASARTTSPRYSPAKERSRSRSRSRRRQARSKSAEPAPNKRSKSAERAPSARRARSSREANEEVVPKDDPKSPENLAPPVDLEGSIVWYGQPPVNVFQERRVSCTNCARRDCGEGDILDDDR